MDVLPNQRREAVDLQGSRNRHFSAAEPR